MAYWLLKSEPESWSWEDQLGVDAEGWDGVRNHQAANNMKAMEIGDQAFFYHSGKTREIVGIVEIVKEYHPDPTDASERFGMVSVRAVAPLQRAITLAEIKADATLQDLALVRQSRLSVVPVSSDHWHHIISMAEKT